MVEMFNVSAQYSEKIPGISQVNFELKKGDFTFVVGPSGSGKSTLMRLIYMDIFPSEGQVVVGEYNSSKIRSREIPYLRRKTGIIFQDFRLLEDRSVYDNVAFVLQVIGEKRKNLKRKVLRALGEVGLTHKHHKWIHELSGGEQQRVGIARAIVNEPLVVLADEPTGNLDPDTSMEILDLLIKINKKGTSVLMATHNYTLVEKLSSAKIIRLENGRIVS